MYVADKYVLPALECINIQYGNISQFAMFHQLSLHSVAAPGDYQQETRWADPTVLLAD